MSPGELTATLGKLVHFFDVPDAVADDNHIDANRAISKVLMVQWSSDQALKLLNWTNRILLLHVYRPSSETRGETRQDLHDDLGSDWTARGQLLVPNSGGDGCKPLAVTMQSVSAQHSDDVEVYQDWQPFSALLPSIKTSEHSNSTIAFSLTRTRWCTKIKEGLMETIKARRVE